MPDDADTMRHDVVDVSAAAQRLGLTPDAIRARLRRGTLEGEKRGNTWYVILPADDARDTRQDADATGDTTPAGGADIAPLVALVDDLTRRNADLSAAAALWQSRAAQLEERLAQLEAGPIAPPPAQDTPDTSTADDTGDHGESVEGDHPDAPTGLWQRLGRWLRGM